MLHASLIPSGMGIMTSFSIFKPSGMGESDRAGTRLRWGVFHKDCWWGDRWPGELWAETGHMPAAAQLPRKTWTSFDDDGSRSFRTSRGFDLRLDSVQPEWHRIHACCFTDNLLSRPQGEIFNSRKMQYFSLRSK
jgi:hypothetical protein